MGSRPPSWSLASFNSKKVQCPSALMATRTFKVSLGENIVRFNLELKEGESSEATLETICAVAVQALGLSDTTSQLVLKYADDEGDLCTLTSHTLVDLLTLVPDGPLRLHASIAAVDTPPAVAANDSSQTVDEAREHQCSTDVDEEKPALPTSPAEGSAEPAPNPMATFVANMAVQAIPAWLPALAADLQRIEKQAKFNRLGVEQRAKVLPLCVRLLEQLDRLPETQPLKPALEAYINGSDTQNFGVFLGQLLQVFSAAISDSRLPIVQNIMRDLVSSSTSMPELGSLLGGLFDGKGMGKGMGMPTSPQPGTAGPDLGTLLGGLLAGKGSGKGGGTPTPSQQGTGGPDLGALLGMFASKGMGKGTGTPTSSPHGAPTPDIGGLLGGLFASKGMGKGMGAPTPSQPGTTGPDLGALLGGLFAAKGMGKGAGAGEGYDTQPPVTVPPVSPTYEQEVEDLMDMGLVQDAEVARDLLRSHGGDLSLVVTMLTTE